MLPDTVATAQPGRLSEGQPLGFPPMVTDVEVTPLAGIPSKEPLHAVVVPVGVYSNLVHSNVVTWGAWDHGTYTVTSGEGCL